MAVIDQNLPIIRSGPRVPLSLEERGLAAGRGIVFGLAIMLPLYAAAALIALLLLR